MRVGFQCHGAPKGATTGIVVPLGAVLVGRGPLHTAHVPSPLCAENGYTSTDEEVSEFSLASDGR